MSTMRHHLIEFMFSLFLLINIGYPAFPQEAHYYLQQISLDQGLSQSTIRCLHRDHIGRLWLGTRNGLNCYDGVQMHTYFENSNQVNGLPDNYIYFITQDRKNTIWIGTGKGLVKYKEDEDSFESIYPNDSIEPIVYSNFFFKGDTLLFGSTNHLSIYEPLDEKVSKVYFKGIETIPLMFKMEKWNDRILVASRWSGLFYCDVNTGNLTTVPFLEEKEILSILKDHRNNL